MLTLEVTERTQLKEKRKEGSKDGVSDWGVEDFVQHTVGKV